jgi:hypothetical protein
MRKKDSKLTGSLFFEPIFRGLSSKSSWNNFLPVILILAFFSVFGIGWEG